MLLVLYQRNLFLTQVSTVIKYHILGGLNNRHLFFTVLKAGKTKSKEPADLVSGESPFPGLQTAFMFCPHMGEREGVSSYKDTNLIIGPTLMISSKLNYCPKAPPPNTITLGGRASTYEIWGIQTFSP